MKIRIIMTNNKVNTPQGLVYNSYFFNITQYGSKTITNLLTQSDSFFDSLWTIIHFSVHKEKYFRNFIKSNRNQNVFIIFDWFYKISKTFLRVYISQFIFTPVGPICIYACWSNFLFTLVDPISFYACWPNFYLRLLVQFIFRPVVPIYIYPCWSNFYKYLFDNWSNLYFYLLVQYLQISIWYLFQFLFTPVGPISPN